MADVGVNQVGDEEEVHEDALRIEGSDVSAAFLLCASLRMSLSDSRNLEAGI